MPPDRASRRVRSVRSRSVSADIREATEPTCLAPEQLPRRTARLHQHGRPLRSARPRHLPFALLLRASGLPRHRQQEKKAEAARARLGLEEDRDGRQPSAARWKHQRSSRRPMQARAAGPQSTQRGQRRPRARYLVQRAAHLRCAHGGHKSEPETNRSNGERAGPSPDGNPTTHAPIPGARPCATELVEEPDAVHACRCHVPSIVCARMVSQWRHGTVYNIPLIPFNNSSSLRPL